MSSLRVFEGVRTLAREAPVAVRVRGGCMAPRLVDGELVEVRAARAYWPGDVIVFRAPDGGLLAHRLLGYRLHAGGLALVTRGDACSTHDAPVPPAQVIGRVLQAPATLAVRARSLGRFLRIVGIALARLSRRR
jgi:signal peptidase I